MSSPLRAILFSAALAVALQPVGSSAATRDVVAVGNAFAGTVSFLDGLDVHECSAR